MVNRLDTKKEFYLIKRARSVVHASRGLCTLIKTTPNVRIELALIIVVIILGFYLGVTKSEWIFIIIAGGVLLSAEAFNTSIEIDIDLTSPDYHPYARDTKDVAAGAVLIAFIMATLVWLLIFIPYFI